MFLRIPLSMIRKCEIVLVPDQVDEDMNVMQADYETVKNTPLPLLDWSEPEITNLDMLCIPILTFTRGWVERHVNKLKGRLIPLTYNLMGDNRPPTIRKKKQVA